MRVCAHVCVSVHVFFLCINFFHSLTHTERERECVCVCVCVRQRTFRRQHQRSRELHQHQVEAWWGLMGRDRTGANPAADSIARDARTQRR